jgi:hypothetical protein
MSTPSYPFPTLQLKGWLDEVNLTISWKIALKHIYIFYYLIAIKTGLSASILISLIK